MHTINKRLIIIVSLVIFVLQNIYNASAQQQWWNNAYTYKRNILIQNNVSNTVVADYPVRLRFDSGTVPTAAELYAASQSSTKGDDFRITYNNTTELSRWVQTFSPSQIDIWFKIQADIGGSASNNTDYQLYFGNASATNPPGDIDDVMPPGKDASTVGLWHFADGTGSTFVDTSGRGHHGNLPNAHGWGDDSFGPYIEWFGGGDNTAWGEVGSSSDFDLNALTLEAWVYPIGGGTPEQTIFFRPAALPENCPGYKFSATDRKIDLQLNCAGGRAWDGQLAFDTWYHIAGTFDGSTMRIYRNGSLIRTVSYNQSVRSTSGRSLFLGGSPFSQTFKGRVRHARISNIARSDFSSAANIAAVTIAPSVTVGDVILQNVAPTADADGPYIFAESGSHQLDASGSFDPDPGDTLTYEWDLDYDGLTFDVDTTGIQPTVSFPDNFLARTIAVRVTDSGGLTDLDTTSLAVNNVAPTATFNVSSPVNEGNSINLSLTNPFDPSNADTVAGFTYAFDCSDGAGYGPFGVSNSTSCPTDDNGSRPVKGKIRDKDGGETEYTAIVTINSVAPTAILANTSGDVIQGESATLAFSDQFDPSSVDTVAGFLYSYDCTDDGTFEASDVSATSFDCPYPTSGNFTARGLIKDKDGDFTPYTVGVTVLTPKAAIERIIMDVNILVTTGVLNQGQGNALIAKLEAAIKKLDQGNVNAAINQLQAFINQVNGFINGGVLTLEEGQPLIDAANKVITVLSG